MISFFPDLNVWLALTDDEHVHWGTVSRWLQQLPESGRLIFVRFTQMGLLRLLTNSAVMGERAKTLREAWSLYDRWLEDPRVQFYLEPRNLEAGLRRALESLAGQQAPKAVGDGYLLACAEAMQAKLVTLDRSLHRFAQENGYAVIAP